MVMTDRIEAIFQDAPELHAQDLEMLAQADPQRRREILGGGEARHRRPGAGQDTGEEPEFSPETAHGLRMLESLDEAVREANLQSRYHSRQGSLHGECLYNGLCDPLEDTERRIRETSGYIDDAERLAE